MNKAYQYCVLVVGILSPLLGYFLFQVVYNTLTRASTNRDKDWLFRLSAATVAMILPWLATLVLALIARRHRVLSIAGKIGVIVAVLSLGLAAKPIRDGVNRWKQTHNLALHDVAAPNFETQDLSGKTQRLEDHKGEVVLLNIWATWCGPCRKEMPNLDRLYQKRQKDGLVVFGISDESVDLQKNFLKKVPVTYPLLTLSGTVPSIYRDIARYPAIFLIDRQGRLQPAPGPDQPFQNVEAAVDGLLSRR